MNAVRVFSRTILLFSVGMAIANTAGAQTFPPLNGFTASAEAAARGEDQRLQATSRQLGTVDTLRWWAGIPPRPSAPLPWSNPPTLDYIYATGRWTTTDVFGRATWADRPRIFEPWPVVPGDLWGYRYVQVADQPVGVFSGQTGPNRWEYRPIYARDMVEVAPPMKSNVPAPTGPREF